MANVLCFTEQRVVLTQTHTHTHTYIYLPTPPLGQDTTQGQAEFNRFEFRVFLLLD